MNNTIAKVISALMIATALLGFAAVFQVNVANALPTPLLFVDPQNSSFPPPTMNVGSSFLVNVSVANITNLAGIQFSLAWDLTLLKVNSMTEVFFFDPLITMPADIPDNINVIKKSYNNAWGNATYGVTWTDGGLAKANGYDPANITTTGSAYGNPSYPWPQGKHGVCTFNFTVLQQPNATVPLLSCALHLSNDILGDADGLPIAHTNVDGTYQNQFIILPPYFTMTTSYPGTTYTAHSIGDIFNVTVMVNDLDASYKAVGFEFKLGYNGSMLSVLHVYEGPWLPPYGASPNQGTSFMHAFGFNATINQDYVGVGDVVMPDENGTWQSPPCFPSGSGVLAIINFNATLQNEVPAPDLTCPLTLFDAFAANTTAGVLPPSDIHPNIGTYIMKSALPPSFGRFVDIFTGWPFPYGGQGLYQHSDMFWPQKAVSLYANVTYNGWAEQQKDVAFQIIAPNNQTWAIIYARTNATGIAYTNFRLPWPCDDPESWFGVWTIIGTVDIACNIVNDTLQFKYDYLVRIVKQTVDPVIYNHTQYINVNINYCSYLENPNAIFFDEISYSTIDLTHVVVVVTAFDEVRVPFGLIDAQLPLISANFTTRPFGGLARELWCQYKYYDVNLTVYIPKFAVAGNGEIDCAVLSDWPYNGGTVISGYFDGNQWLPYCPTLVIITNTPVP